MESLFLSVLNMSLTASYVIIAILLVRFLLKNAPKKYRFVLWAAAAFRLVCPVSFQAVFSLFRPLDLQMEQNTLTSVSQQIGYQKQPQVYLGVPVVSENVSQSLPPANPMGSINPIQVWIFVGTVLWVAGIIVLLVYGIISYVKLRCTMRNATVLEGRVYESDRIRSPFILGFIRPRIYIPYGLEDLEKSYILIHERFHLKHGDHLIKPLAWLILVVHWFNPLVWLAFYLMGKDMEMRCDEAVLAGEENIRKSYSTTLLSFAANRRFPSPSPLAFGESAVKTRIKNILRWKSPKLWVTVTAAVLCVAVIAACAANPVQRQEPASEVPEQPQTVVMPETTETESLPEEVPAVLEPIIQEPEIQVFGDITVDATLSAALDQAVRTHCRSSQTDRHIALWTGTIIEQLVGCGAAETDDPKAPVGFTRVKMMVRYAEFTVKDDRITEEGGVHLPMAFAFTQLQDGSLVLNEVWQPRDGSYYAEDIRAEFMEENWEAALDTQLYIEQHNRGLFRQLVQCGYVNREAAIKQLLAQLKADSTDVTTQRQLRYLGYNPLARGRWISAEPTSILGEGAASAAEAFDKYTFHIDGTGTHTIGDVAEQPFTYAYSEDYSQIVLTYEGGQELIFELEMQGESRCILSNHRATIQLNWY